MDVIGCNRPLKMTIDRGSKPFLATSGLFSAVFAKGIVAIAKFEIVRFDGNALSEFWEDRRRGDPSFRGVGLANPIEIIVAPKPAAIMWPFIIQATKIGPGEL